MKPRIGVVCTAGRDLADGRRTLGAESYVVCQGERIAWFEGGEERAERQGGTGVLLAVADGEAGTTEDAAIASSSACRVLAKLWRRPPPADPSDALSDFIAAAHTRMFWKVRERGAQLGASCAAAWLVGTRLAWVELGTSRVLLQRAGTLRRLSSPWLDGDRQRFLGGSQGLGDDTAVHLVRGRNVGVLELLPGDQVVLATDGLWGGLDERSAAHVLQHVGEAQVAAVTLMDRALAQGARDAVTVAILDVRPPVPSQPVTQAPAPLAPPGAPLLRRDEPPVRRRLRHAITEP